MKSKFLLTILLLITTVCLFSFINKEKSKSKKAKFFSCGPTSSPVKVGRGGYYVSVAWTGPSNAYFTYYGYSTITGRSFSGKTYSTQVTVDDHNEGGTMTVTAHCTDSTTSGASHGTWTAN
jgi:hypothetical protein